MRNEISYSRKIKSDKDFNEQVSIQNNRYLRTNAGTELLAKIQENNIITGIKISSEH